MEDISRVSPIEFGLGRGQTAIFPKEGKGGKGRQKSKSSKAQTSEDEFHLHDETVEDSVEILNKDHVDVEV